jgi:replication factor C large subunit
VRKLRLWTEKHKPKAPEEMAGNGQAISEMKRLLSSWKQGTGIILYGPTGTGKTLLVELLAKDRGDFLVHLDASETMTGKSIEETLSTTSRQQTLFHRGKLILLDEVDCLSGRADRGASGGIVKLINGSKFPVIVCVNDIQEPKLRPVKKVCKRVKLEKVERPEMVSFLRGVAKKEGISVSDEVLGGLARWSDGDVRSAILDFQMLCLGKKVVTDDHFLSLGFRERKKGMDDVLTGLMRTPSLKANRMALWNADADSDDVFLWLESNLFRTTSDPVFIADAYEKLSKADMLRSRVGKQRNWRFKAYMSDIMAGIGALRRGAFVKPEAFRTPDRIILLARARFKKAVTGPIIEKMAGKLHCSRRVAGSDYFPYLSFMARKGAGVPEELELTPEEVEALKKY